MTAYNWRTIAVQTVIVGAAALGMTLIMISGGIDLSVGSVVALTTIVEAVLSERMHVSIWVILPILGLVETTKPLPSSISESVLRKDAPLGASAPPSGA